MKQMSFDKLRQFYIDHLFNTLISFWMRFGIDQENGGFYTCFNNTAARTYSTEHEDERNVLWITYLRLPLHLEDVVSQVRL